MTVAIETLTGDDALAFREAIKPHVVAVLDEENYKSAGYIDTVVEEYSVGFDAKVLLAQNWATGTLPGGLGTKSAREYAEIVGDAATVLVARDLSVAAAEATALHKANAETAQAGAQAAAVQTGADRADTAADRLATANDRAAIENWSGEVLGPTMDSFFDANGQPRFTDQTSPINDAITLLGPRGPLIAPGIGITGDTGKLVAIGYYAAQYTNSYDSTAINWRALRYSVGNFATAIGVHCGEEFNKAGSLAHGFGIIASGSVTFTGNPSATEEVEINDVVFPFVAGAPANNYEVQIGATREDTLAALTEAMCRVTDTALRGLIWRRSGNVLHIQGMGAGTWANAIALGATSASVAVSGATLSGGTTQANGADPINFIGNSLVGVSAGKRAAPAYPRAARGFIGFTGVPTVGSFLEFGSGTTFGTSGATNKRIPWVAAGAATLEINQGTDAASSIRLTVEKLESIKAGYTMLAALTFWMAPKGMVVTYNSTSMTGNLSLCSATGVNVTSAQKFMSGAFTTIPNGNCCIGANIEQIQGGDNFAAGYSAGRFATAINSTFIGANSGSGSIGNYNFYANSAGQNVIGSNNIILTPAGGGAVAGTPLAVQSISASGLITLQGPIDDAVLAQIGARFIFTPTTATNYITEDGAKMAKVHGIVVSPNQVQIVDYTDSPTGAVYGSVGTVTAITITPSYARHDYAVAWFDAPESGVFHIGGSKQTEAKTLADILTLPKGRLQISESLVGGAAPATGFITFITASGNFADGETVELGGVVFTAKASAAFATGNASMIRWFRIGVDMWDSLTNLLACARNSDDNSAASRVVNRASYFLSGVGSGWRFNVRVDADTSGNDFTLATSKAGAIISAPSGAAPGTNLPVAASQNPPKDGEIKVLSSWPRARGERALMQYKQSQNTWRFLGGA